MENARRALPRWRSLLFVPANVERYIAGAHRRGADAVILDLEDAVPISQKDTARAALAGSIEIVGESGSAAMVRVNHPLRWLVRDLEAAVVRGLAALVLPKVESAGFVSEVADAVAELEVERGLSAGSVRLVLQIETPTALFELPAIARAHPRVAAITLGPEDFGLAWGDAEFRTGPRAEPRSAARGARRERIAARLYRKHSDILRSRCIPRDGAPSSQFRVPRGDGDLSLAGPGTERSVRPDERGNRLGPPGRRGDAAARTEGRGAFQLDGRMIDAPVVRRAEDILAMIEDPGLPTSPG